MGVFWGGNKVFRVQGTLRKPSGTISFHFEAIWRNRKKSWIFDFFMDFGARSVLTECICLLWWLLLMTFLLIISIVHQHFFRHQHFQITNFSWSATFFASATFVKTERVLPFQYVLSTPTKSSSHKCKT